MMWKERLEASRRSRELWQGSYAHRPQPSACFTCGKLTPVRHRASYRNITSHLRTSPMRTTPLMRLIPIIPNPLIIHRTKPTKLKPTSRTSHMLTSTIFLNRSSATWTRLRGPFHSLFTLSLFALSPSGVICASSSCKLLGFQTTAGVPRMPVFLAIDTMSMTTLCACEDIAPFENLA